MSEGPEAYPLGYVEGLNDARMLLAGFFSFLLEDSHGPVPGPAVRYKGGWSTFRKERFGEATRVTGKMVQVHHGAATVSGE